jgi:dipeptidyl aminopeptidase/acylaminoacyl peptidase
MRPDIPFDRLAPVKPVSYAARDGTVIHAYLTLPPGREAKGLPLILLPHGGPYGVRDKLDYDDEVQFLASRGYAVLQPNYRGSDGYGEAFEKLGDGQIGRAMQDDLDDAEDWAVAQGLADKGRVCVVGSSYGGYAALWAAIRNPERYRCAASFAGVTDFTRQLRYDANFFTRKNEKAWRTRVRGEDKSFDLEAVSPAKQAARLTRPILLAHGKLDSTVPFNQFKEMRDALDSAHSKLAEYLVFDKEGHGFDIPADEQKWLDGLEAFLKKNNPAD